MTLISARRVALPWAACFTLAMALVVTACGSSPSSKAEPPTATSVANALKNSSMKNAHFTVQGTLANGANRYTATGDGTIQVKPEYALQLNLQVATGTFLGTIGVDEIAVNGNLYTRTGSEGWMYEPDPSATAPMTPDKYVGEETLNGTKAWHVQSKDEAGTYDMWVRVSDGYLMKMALATTDGTSLTMTFDSYNTGTTITAPEGATPASPSSPPSI